MAVVRAVRRRLERWVHPKILKVFTERACLSPRGLAVGPSPQKVYRTIICYILNINQGVSIRKFHGRFSLSNLFYLPALGCVIIAAIIFHVV